MFSVIIPSRNTDNVEACVRNIEPGPRILVIGDELEVEYSATMIHPGIQPFVFSRNVNIGIKIAGGDVVVMNDDAVLVYGSLENLMFEAVKIGGIVSASVRGVVNNPEQIERRRRDNIIRQLNTGYLAFICVAIPRSIIDKIGMLDERFGGANEKGELIYGGEDVDYCHLARVNGIPLAVHDGVVVDHGNILSSTFRRNTVPNIEPGLQILREKWKKIQNTPLPV